MVKNGFVFRGVGRKGAGGGSKSEEAQGLLLLILPQLGGGLLWGRVKQDTAVPLRGDP